MASVTIATDFLEDIATKIHDLNSDTLKLALGNTAPSSETNNPLEAGNGVLANFTEISNYSNYSDDMTTDRVLEGVSAGLDDNGNLKLDADDVIVTASGGAIAPFRYVALFNASSANDEIIEIIDHGSAISLADTQTLLIRWNSGGILLLSK